MLRYIVPFLIIMIIVILLYIFCIKDESIDEEFILIDKTDLEQINLEIKKVIYSVIMEEAEGSAELFGDEKIFDKSNGRYTLEHITDRDYLVDTIVKEIHKIIADNICKGKLMTKYSDRELILLIKKKGYIEEDIIMPLVETNRLTNEGFQYTTKRHISNIIYKNNNFMDILKNI